MFNRRLASEARPQRGRLVASQAFSLLAGALVVAQAWLVANVINAVFLGGLTLQQMWPRLRWLAGVIVARSVATGASELFSRQISIHIKQDLRARLLRHLVALGPAGIQGERSGELTSTLTEGVEGLQSYFSEYLPALTQAVALPLIILIAIFPLDPLSGVVLLLTAPLIPVFMLLIGRLAEQGTHRQWKTLGRLSGHFLDVLQGLTTLKLFGRSRDQAAAIRDASRQYADATLGVLRIAFLSALALELLATLSTAVVAVEIGLRLLYGGLQFEQTLFILILAPEFYAPLRNLGARFHSGISGIAASARIFEILDQPLPLRGAGDPPHAISLISFTDVSYQHTGADAPILQHVTFNLEPSTLTALVGPTGVGKSTLMNLLLAFLRPHSGSITINGLDLNYMDPDAWRARLAWVPQKPYLFHDTIATNLRLAASAASETQLWGALEKALLADAVRSFPDGLQTQVGERGVHLSGGQAQRLALARAYLKDTPLLLLDEPTAHLDSATEAAVTAALETWRAGRFVLTIAHRVATIEMADQIIRLPLRDQASRSLQPKGAQQLSEGRLG